MLNVVVFLVSLGVRVIRAMCRRRADLVLENVALRQQVTALKKERPRPPLEDTERAFWVALRGSWPVWASRPSCAKTRLCLLFIHPPAPWVGSQPCGAK